MAYPRQLACIEGTRPQPSPRGPPVISWAGSVPSDFSRSPRKDGGNAPNLDLSQLLPDIEHQRSCGGPIVVAGHLGPLRFSDVFGRGILLHGGSMVTRTRQPSCFTMASRAIPAERVSQDAVRRYTRAQLDAIAVGATFYLCWLVWAVRDEPAVSPRGLMQMKTADLSQLVDHYASILKGGGATNRIAPARPYAYVRPHSAAGRRRMKIRWSSPGTGTQVMRRSPSGPSPTGSIFAIWKRSSVISRSPR